MRVAISKVILDFSKKFFMGKRYYCDFCDRSFADSLEARKKHINGVQHQRNRKLHYDSFKDPIELLAEEASKPPCRRFFQTGSCDYAPRCKYSHTNPELLVASQNTDAAQAVSVSKEGPSLEKWLHKWQQRKKKKRESAREPGEQSSTSEKSPLPPGLPPLHELPPSLRPPPPEGYPELPVLDWG